MIEASQRERGRVRGFACFDHLHTTGFLATIYLESRDFTLAGTKFGTLPQGGLSCALIASETKASAHPLIDGFTSSPFPPRVFDDPVVDSIRRRVVPHGEHRVVHLHERTRPMQGRLDMSFARVEYQTHASLV